MKTNQYRLPNGKVSPFTKKQKAEMDKHAAAALRKLHRQFQWALKHNEN